MVSERYHDKWDIPFRSLFHHNTDYTQLQAKNYNYVTFYQKYLELGDTDSHVASLLGMTLGFVNRVYPSNSLTNCSLSFRCAPHPEPPLCKGRCQKSPIFDGGVVKNAVLGQSLSQLRRQLPLHKGALGAPAPVR